MSGYEVSGFAETGWSFIEKPFALQTLVQKVATTLKEGSPPEGGPDLSIWESTPGSYCLAIGRSRK